MSPHPEDVFWSEYTDYCALKILHNNLQEDIQGFKVSPNFNLMFILSILTKQIRVALQNSICYFAAPVHTFKEIRKKPTTCLKKFNNLFRVTHNLSLLWHLKCKLFTTTAGKTITKRKQSPSRAALLYDTEYSRSDPKSLFLGSY